MPPPSLLPRLGGVLGGVTAAAKPPNLFNCPLLSIGLGSSPSSSSTSSRSSRCFSSNAEQSSRSRRWWSDEAQFDDDDDEFEEDEEEGSSFSGSATWDQVLDEPWFTKMLRAYGYVLPMILVSMLVATGPQAFLLAMAIPLAQSAVSFAIRVFSNTFGRRDQEEYDDDYYSDYRSSGWEEPEYSNSSSSSTRYNGSSSSRSQQQQQPWAKDDKSEDSEPKREADDIDSANSSSYDTSKSGSVAGFGGWDELDAGDDQYINSRSNSSSSRQSAGPSPAADTATTGGGGGRAARSVRRSMRRPQPETATRRRRSGAAVRYRQSPLFMRLLVALFPFLGSWFRIML